MLIEHRAYASTLYIRAIQRKYEDNQGKCRDRCVDEPFENISKAQNVSCTPGLVESHEAITSMQRVVVDTLLHTSTLLMNSRL